MATAISRRQQVRNERTLQDLIKAVPGNDKCADCAARNPGWASWSLGIFLCVRCASLHRKLGVHISKVKSLSMDAWTSEQVENMKSIGNTKSNRTYNPRNTKPSIPMDIDEVDGVIERFIRQKYETKTLSSESQPTSRQDTGSTGSSEEHATPLPPKPTKRFTFSLRSSTSALSLSRSSRSNTHDIIEENGVSGFGYNSKRQSPQKKNKPSKIFGADIGGSRHDNYELKLIALREMGFPDDKRNLVILKGEGGNVDKAVATLIRLGEGSRASSGSSSPAPETPPKDEPSPMNGKMGNPFDRLDLQDKALPPPPAEAASQIPSASFATSSAYNPFLQPQTQQLQQSFQNLTISQPPSLFPNATGGYGSSQPTTMTNPFLQTYTPPPQIHALQNQQGPFAAPPSNLPQATYNDQQQNAMPASNPFLQSTGLSQSQNSNIFGMPQPQYATQYFSPAVTSQQTSPYNAFNNNNNNNNNSPFPSPSISNPFVSPGIMSTYPPQNPVSPTFAQQNQLQSMQSNPFMQNSTMAGLAVNTQPHFTQTGFVQSPLNQSPTQQQQATNPFQSQMPQNVYPQQHSQSIPAPMRFDKASILALYQSHGAGTAAPGNVSYAAQAENQGMEALHRSNTMPAPSTTADRPQAVPTQSNPFYGASNPQTSSMSVPVLHQPPTNPAFNRIAGHVSHESVDFNTMLNGRHSPDAFAGLSARLAR